MLQLIVLLPIGLLVLSSTSYGFKYSREWQLSKREGWDDFGYPDREERICCFSHDKEHFCIFEEQRCDGKEDCMNGEDERDCNVNVCSKNQGFEGNLTAEDAASLHKAAAKGKSRCLASLLNGGANIEAKYSWGATPLHLAALHGHTHVIRVLLRVGANVAATDRALRQPLHMAVWGDCAECVDALVSAGAVLDAADMLGRSALWTAAWKSNALSVGRLVKAGANIAAPDNRGCSPLIAAINSRCDSCVKTLLDAGASPTGETSCKSPLSYAVSAKSLKHIELLLNAGAEVDDYSLLKAVMEDCVQCMELLILAGADTNRISDEIEENKIKIESEEMRLILLLNYLIM